MVASIKVYDDDANNTLLFDSSRATIPTFYTKKEFSLAEIQVVGTGYNQYGRVNVAGLTPALHFCFSVQSANSVLNNDLPAMTSLIYPSIEAGYLKIYYDLLIIMRLVDDKYPNVKYFVDILEFH